MNARENDIAPDTVEQKPKITHQGKPNRLIQEKALICSNMLLILWIGIHGVMRHFKQQPKEISPFFFLSGTRLAIGAT